MFLRIFPYDIARMNFLCAINCKRRFLTKTCLYLR